ncbi:gamma-interferon-inducible lysosomal thiol reductase-like [Littorina saxatilis]|uniref:Saposin A-type domain-containing protein n=1 Tax=Littorina saxatilis TaxID=31220 RepID=A0AAN9G199_9CAEN
MKTFLLLIAVAGAAGTCRFPPQLWCSSEEIAIQCKVYQQCKESVWTVKTNAALVEFELYFESLCPDCRNFIKTQLFPTYTKVGSIMNITLVPYGNAREKQSGDRWVFTCQHGEQECIGNLLETCAIHTLKSIDRIMPFIHCMELSEYPLQSVQSCSQQLSVPLDPIMFCYNSTVGNTLEHKMAQKTEALNPPHKYVPWVVLNGVHTEKINDEAARDLLKLVCDTYTGTKPSACTATRAQLTGCAQSDL